MRQLFSVLIKAMTKTFYAPDLYRKPSCSSANTHTAAKDSQEAHRYLRKLCLLPISGMLLSMWLCILFFLTRAEDGRNILSMGFAMSLLVLAWTLFLLHRLTAQLADFTLSLCRTIDRMTEGDACPDAGSDKETLKSRINCRLLRLYQIMQTQKHAAEKEYQKLQQLITDISHQVKTPVSNLMLVTDTLLTRPGSAEEQTVFLKGLKNQTDKLHFLFQALLKTSQLETGAIQLQKSDTSLYATIAQALSGILCQAGHKHLSVTVSCPEALCLPHDRIWTSEALFNLLDNAVKYTPEGGSIRVSAELWEMYAKIDITDTGIGIPESSHAAIFRRFYREHEVHNIPGVGIGLYLTRKIVTLQGGYVIVASAPGEGSTFSVFLPRHF